MNNKCKKKNVGKCDEAMRSPECDPQGMYTGTPLNPYEEPIQDADDL